MAMRSASFFFVTALPVLAQAPRLAEQHLVLPMDAGPVVHGDIDGNGHPDCLFRASQPSWTIWFFGPEDRVQKVPVTPAQADAEGLTLADLDGDGDLDLVCRHAAYPSALPYPFPPSVSGGTLRTAINLGSGVFQTLQTFGGDPAYGGEVSTDVAAGDVDGDGDADLVVAVASFTASGWPGVQGGRNRLWLNNGTGTFVDATNNLPVDNQVTTTVRLADFDGDGDRDVYFGNAPSSGPGVSAQDRLLLNNGAGVFVAAAFPPDTADNQVAVASDFDLDGDVDLLLRDLPMRYLSNAGNATFTVTTPPLPYPAASSQLLTGDWNVDGKLDYSFLEPGTNGPGLWRPVMNLGGGQFGLVPAADQGLAGLSWYHQVESMDVEADGDPDLVVLSGMFETRVLRNVGFPSIQLLPTEIAFTIRDAKDLTTADIDRDGDADLLVAYYQGCAYYQNDGHGRFVEMVNGAFSTDGPVVEGFAFGDLDGDGDADAVVVRGGTTRLVWNTQGVLATSMSIGQGGGNGAALADVDGDGDLDVYVHGGFGDRVLRNQGGTFATVVGGTPAGLATECVRLADLDGDGDPDAIAVGTQTNVLRNNGAGVFTQWTTTGITVQPEAVVTGDWDGDGDIDVVAAGSVWRNQGNGTFVATMGAPSAPRPRLLVAADFDADGDLDLYRARFSVSPSGANGPGILLRNNGLGAFSEVSNAIDVRPLANVSVTTADFDGDGDLDLAHAGFGPPRVAWNRHRHLSWQTLGRVGHTLVLAIQGRSSEPWILALAPNVVRTAIPGFGVLRLDPATLGVVAVGTCSPAGEASFSIAVPPVPAMIGLAAHWQTLFGNGPCLSNLETTTLLAQ